VMSLAKGENIEEDVRINRERTVISSIEEKKFQHIARYYDDCSEGFNRALLYIENYMPQNLHDFNATKELGIGTKLSWLYQLAQVLCHFKRNNLVHVDLKPSNIVLAKNFFLKVIDFAEALIKGKVDKDEFKRATTMPFSAPEALDEEQGGISFESDVFSFAHIAYELLGGKLMVGFKKTCEPEVRTNYKNREFKFLPIANWMNYLGPQYIMQYMYYMIMLCSTADPSVRFPQEALVNFIKEFALYTEKLF
jgi:serine/threonine protein kinase